MVAERDAALAQLTAQLAELQSRLVCTSLSFCRPASGVPVRCRVFCVCVLRVCVRVLERVCACASVFCASVCAYAYAAVCVSLCAHACVCCRVRSRAYVWACKRARVLCARMCVCVREQQSSSGACVCLRSCVRVCVFVCSRLCSRL